MNRSYIYLSVLNKNGKTIGKVGSHKKMRILHFIQAKKYKDCTFDVCVKYSESFKNEGIYKTKKKLIYALKMFTEKDLVKEFR